MREVREEIGLSCTLGEELPPVFYTDHKGRAKAVRYWLMAPAAGGFEANEEVDAMRWLEPTQARRELTYPHDAELAAQAQETLAR